MGEQKRRQAKYADLQRILDRAQAPEIRDAINDVTKMLTDRGQLIEAGWVSLRIMSVPDDAPPIQIDEMRNAFFAGAQHLFHSIMSILDPGEEPTDADMSRLDKIDKELRGFIEEFKLRHLLHEGQA